jgi:hypothetical protein
VWASDWFKSEAKARALAFAQEEGAQE